MGVNYLPVLWNKQKKKYDRIMLIAVGLYFSSFVGFNLVFHPEIVPPTLIIRATGSLALIMLHFILIIGPLARINRHFQPLLYNRRHLGVTMFLFALVHAIMNIFQFHSLGNENPFVSIFVSNTHYESFVNFPFQSLGFFALVILFIMAATSHDFWLHNLGAKVWKTLHMLVYFAYALIIMHVMLGVIQLESSLLLVGLLALGLITVISLHLIAGFKTRANDNQNYTLQKDGFFEVCDIKEIRESRAKMVSLEDHEIAIFKYDEKLSAVDNVCKHQNGPLSEGKIIDGCITCPWHGYQYQPADGCSPPPFTEKVSTYELRIEGSKVWVNPNPKPEGTFINPILINTEL